MRILITGGAGFLGSSLTEYLVSKKHDVIVLDNFSSGALENISSITNDIELIKGDCLNKNDVDKSLQDVETVIHLAANPEVRIELNNSTNCFEQNVLATYRLLESIKNSKVKNLFFTSTSAVYGRSKIIPTPTSLSENLPISIYAGSKLASESLISSYAHIYDKKAVIVRLANIVGPRSNHGVLFDFVKKLKKDPSKLSILGDGNQIKSYLHVDDFISAIDVLMNSEMSYGANVFNIGSTDQITVHEIAKSVGKSMKLNEFSFEYQSGTEDGGGWKGDVTNMLLDITKIKHLGWLPTMSSKEAIEKTVIDMND